MRKIFYSLNEAIDFATQQKAVNIDRFNLYETGAIGREVTRLGKEIGLDIDGFSDVRPLIYVYYGNEDSSYNEIQYRGCVLKVEGYGNYYISNMDKKKVGLSSLILLNASYSTFQSFRTALVAPQNIGKATKTKIINWCEYVNQLEAEKLRFYNERKARREKAIATLKENGVQAVSVGQMPYEGSFEYQPMKFIHISKDGLKIVWEFDSHGFIGKSYGYDFTKADALSRTLDGLDK